MPWSFLESKDTSYAPPPEGYVAKLLAFVDENATERSIPVFLPVNHTDVDVTRLVEKTKANLDAGEL
jgi:hypothetical protein